MVLKNGTPLHPVMFAWVVDGHRYHENNKISIKRYKKYIKIKKISPHITPDTLTGHGSECHTQVQDQASLQIPWNFHQSSCNGLGASTTGRQLLQYISAYFNIFQLFSSHCPLVNKPRAATNPQNTISGYWKTLSRFKLGWIWFSNLLKSFQHV